MRAFTEEKSVTLGRYVNYLALYLPSHVAGKKTLWETRVLDSVQPTSQSCDGNKA